MRKRLKRFLSLFMILSMIISNFSLVFANTNGNNNSENQIKRDNVLLLDTSGSMGGTPLKAMKTAAIKFCDEILKSDDDNRVALILWNSSLRSYDFTSDIEELKSIINGCAANGGTDTGAALEAAKNLLDSKGREDAIRNIVLCTDGLPEHGGSTTEGPYTSADSTYYGHANLAYNVAKEIHKDSYIYTLGFFHALSGAKKTFGVRFLRDLQNGGYYEVVDPNELEFAFGDIAEQIQRNVKLKGEFYYPSGDYYDYSATYYYDDEYFKESSYKHKPSLATMSMCLAWAAMASNAETSYEKKSKNVENLLTEIGFSHFDKNDFYTVKPTLDSIGVVAAYKMLQNDDGSTIPLIAVAVRGGGYEREWGSNFTIGREGEHQGFSEAKENVCKFLGEYVKKQGLTGDIKLWITGYSRASATANLVAGELDLHPEQILGTDVKLAPENLFMYGNETPAGILDSTSSESKVNPHDPLFWNIFNTINPCDLVPKVAPATMKFTRYGLDMVLDSKEVTSEKLYTDNVTNMLTIFDSLQNVSKNDYLVDDFQMKKIGIYNWMPFGEKISLTADDKKHKWGQSTFLNEFLRIVFDEYVVNRDHYVDALQDRVRTTCNLYYGCEVEQREKLLDVVGNIAKEKWTDVLWKLVTSKGSREEVYGVVSGWIKQGIDEAGITGFTDEEIDNVIFTFCDWVIAIAAEHPNYATTLYMNVKNIANAHFPELCYSWLASKDDNYMDEKKSASYPTAAYRVIRINCPVDAYVYDVDHKLVASIVGDVPQDLADSSMISAINENDEKEFYLPADYEYSLEILATGDGDVNIALSEYSYAANDYVRNVNYYNIPVVNGDVIRGHIPAAGDADKENAFLTGSKIEYQMVSPYGNEIKPDRDATGNEIAKTMHTVKVTTNASDVIVLGSGIYMEGSFAKVTTAYEESTKKFLGWYVDGKCVSTDLSYRFCVKSDVSMEARYEETVKSISGADVVLSETEYVYDGTMHTPAVTVTLEGKKLVENTDYKVTYSKNVEAGNAEVKVTGIGSYSGEKTVYFTILKASSTSTLSFATTTVYKTTKDKDFINPISGVTNEKITYKSSNNKVAVVKGGSGEVKIKGVGTATITAIVRGNKGNANVEVSYTVVVTK